MENPRIVHADTETPGKVVFVFSGSGSQSTIIGSELYKSDKVFAAYLDACFNCCVEKGLKTIYDDFFHFGQRTKEKKLDNGTGMLIIFSVGYALAMRLIDLGIEPQCMIGHSLGEYIAATVGGIFMYEDAIDLLIKRAALIESLEPGGMLNVACSRKKLEECLIEGVEIGAYNASNRFMVAGSKEAVDAFEKMLPQQRIAGFSTKRSRRRSSSPARTASTRSQTNSPNSAAISRSFTTLNSSTAWSGIGARGRRQRPDRHGPKPGY